MWNLMRRLGKWLQEWPCRHGYHDWSLKRPGTALWWQDCAHCGLSRAANDPKSNDEVDMAAYRRYRARFERQKPRPEWMRRLP